MGQTRRNEAIQEGGPQRTDTENQHVQDEIGQAVDAFEAIADEAKRERLIDFVAEL